MGWLNTGFMEGLVEKGKTHIYRIDMILLINCLKETHDIQTLPFIQ